MEIGSASQDFMTYVAAIEQASFGTRSTPVGVSPETVALIANNAKEQSKKDISSYNINVNTANHAARQQNEGHVLYDKIGKTNASTSRIGTEIAISV